jgi:hypothetical protein
VLSITNQHYEPGEDDHAHGPAGTRQALFIEASSRRHGGGPDYLSLIANAD